MKKKKQKITIYLYWEEHDAGWKNPYQFNGKDVRCYEIEAFDLEDAFCQLEERYFDEVGEYPNGHAPFDPRD
jgi:hypothetical protein